MTILETFWLKCRLGSLVNLAKHPSSTVQILGAEKALFRALKTKHDTPKYGLIYHASLVGQSNAKNKGKVSQSVVLKYAVGRFVRFYIFHLRLLLSLFLIMKHG